MTSDQSSDSRPSRFLPALYHNPIPTVSQESAAISKSASSLVQDKQLFGRQSPATRP